MVFEILAGDDCGVSNEEDPEVGEVTSFLCLVNNI